MHNHHYVKKFTCRVDFGFTNILNAATLKLLKEAFLPNSSHSILAHGVEPAGQKELPTSGIERGVKNFDVYSCCLPLNVMVKLTPGGPINKKPKCNFEFNLE